MLKQEETKRRPHLGRLFLWTTLGLLALGIWRYHASSGALWSLSQRDGGVTDVLALGDRVVAASLWGNRLVSCHDGGSLKFLPYDRPIQLLPDGYEGAYVLGLLSNTVGHLNSAFQIDRRTEFPPSTAITAVLSEPAGVCVVGYDRRRADERPKEVIYLPEISRFRWYVRCFTGMLPEGDARLDRGGTEYTNDRWHEETGGVWRLAATRDRLIVVKDQAETINCLARDSGRLLWQASTGPRPTGAVIWGDRVLVASGQAGTVEAYRLDNGGRVWPQPAEVGRGLAGMALFADKIVMTDVVHNRLVMLDPVSGLVTKELKLDGGPRAMFVDADGLWIGLDSASALVHLDWAWRENKRCQIGTGGDS